jgi:hypothetical protein
MQPRAINMVIIGPRGRHRNKTIVGSMTADNRGFNMSGSFRGPFGGLWQSKTTITYDQALQIALEEMKNPQSREQFKVILRGMVKEAREELIKIGLEILQEDF